MKSIVILGAAGQGKVVLDILRSGKRFKPIGFLDDDPSLRGQKVCGLPVLGPISGLGSVRKKAVAAVAAVGDNGIRYRLFQNARKLSFELPMLIHPSVVVAKDVVLGAGCQLAPGAILVTGSRIGENVIVNTGATVDHDCRVLSHSFLAPGSHLAGYVEVGEGAWVGIGACVLQGLKIGARAVVGAGAVILKDVPERAVVIGVPGRVLRYQKFESLERSS